MNALDQLLEGEEPLVCDIAEDVGILAAEDFVRMFNNACLHIAGFESTLVNQRLTSRLAPITNMSVWEH